MVFLNLSELYDYFDKMVNQDCTQDELFASSYLRGFIALSAAEFGDETQHLSAELANSISEKIQSARTELSPSDRVLVDNYWSKLTQAFG